MTSSSACSSESRLLCQTFRLPHFLSSNRCRTVGRGCVRPTPPPKPPHHHLGEFSEKVLSHSCKTKKDLMYKLGTGKRTLANRTAVVRERVNCASLSQVTADPVTVLLLSTQQVGTFLSAKLATHKPANATHGTHMVLCAARAKMLSEGVKARVKHQSCVCLRTQFARYLQPDGTLVQTELI